MAKKILELPTPAVVTPKKVNDPEREYILADGYSLGQRKFLGSTIDDVEIEIDLRTYDRMENDAIIAKAKKIVITNALTDELQMSPGATEEEVSQSEYDTYVAVMEFCERMICGLDRPIKDALEQLLGNAFSYGHGIGEVVWEYRKDGSHSKPPEKPKSPVPAPNAPKASIWQRMGLAKADTKDTPTSDPLKRPILEGEKIRLMPKAIKVKPRGSALFVVDDYMNVLGLVPRRRRLANSATPSNVAWDEVVDREKFLVLTLNRKDEDPRGRSTLRPAFNWYNLKSQIPGELLRFILEESVPKAVGTLSPDAAPFEYERDAANNIINDPITNEPKMLTAAESFARQIAGFRSGSGAVIPHGATLEPFKKYGAGDANLFPIVIKAIDDQIENAILLQTLAQSEGEHQARSAAQQVAELLYNLMFWIKYALAQTILMDLLEVGVRKNLGDWAVDYLPMLSLGDFVRRDWTEELNALADAYFKGFLDDTQRAELMAWMNLPKPGQSRQELGLQAAAKQDVNGQPVPDPSQRPDKVGTDRNKGNGTEKKNARKKPTAGSSFSNALGHNSRWFRRSR